MNRDVIDPRDKTVHELFEEVALGAPGSVALAYEGGEITYGSLNARANAVASRLRRLGVGRGTLVAICVERSPELIVGLLGILKAGGVYVPLDVGYPEERIAFLLRDTAACVLVTRQLASDQVARYAQRNGVRCLELGDSAVEEGEGDADNPAGGATATDLAYVMYTSGSTGTPKGVMVGHRAVVRLVWNTNYCHFGPGEVFLQLAPISFDASTFEIWGALLNGARLAIMPPGTPALDEVGAAIRRHGVTTLWLTSGLFNLMVEQRVEDLRPLRQLLAGGDVLSPPHVKRALDELTDGVLINGYGPTESTTFACCFRMEKGYRPEGRIPIGGPIAGTTVHVLDERLDPVPVGTAGELYIGGDGLAHGYLNHPELTCWKFVPDPFRTDPGARLYRTGDRACIRPDGDLDFLGRLDDQVKILGHRVEPGEIEAVLRGHPDVRQAIVTARTDPQGEKRLVAYVVGGAGGPSAGPALRAYLLERLPCYLVPSEFIELEGLPLTPNGKVDRAALHVRDGNSRGGVAPAPPAPGLEQEVRTVLGRILGCEVGLDDNFFDLGGDSLQLIEVHAELQRRHLPELSLTDLFEYTTVRAIARRLARSQAREPILALAQAQAQDRARRQREALARTVRPGRPN